MTDAALEYWEGSEPSSGSFCPEAALFRFLGSLGTQLHGSRVLEVGCGANRGVSLSECRRRGAEAFGTDLSEDLLSSARSADPELHLSRSRAPPRLMTWPCAAADWMSTATLCAVAQARRLRRQEARRPDRFASARHGAMQDHETGQIVVLASQSVIHPGTDTGAALQEHAGVHLQHGRRVVVGLGVA